MMKKNPYQILGVRKDADLASIKKAYRRAAKRFHPDISPGKEKEFRDAQEAYDLLSDPQKRSEYDRKNISSPSVQISSAETIFPSFSPMEFFDRLFFDFRDRWFSPSSEYFTERTRRPPSLAAEIILTPEEAEQGGEISLPVQFEIRCESCLGSDRFARFFCEDCLGSGKIGQESTVRLRIPAGVRNGLVQRIPLWRSGYQEIYLTLTFLVRPD